MKIYVDIDDTICYYDEIVITREKGKDYSSAKPYKERIEKINKLYDEGHEITYWTARGTMTGIKWFNVTLKQLKEWLKARNTGGNDTKKPRKFSKANHYKKVNERYGNKKNY